MKPIKTTCPVTKTAQLLSDTWTMLIARALLGGPMHFCELERALLGISTRTLTLKLKKLEDEGMVRKLRDGTYAPTKKGEGLKVIERAMRRYGERYL
ncbi:MAG: putative transcriptional regulator superfamily [Parcubacteria group bacterium Gr01-1014_56]|nr:MAG: putative transcriptional regulator superfamily [Parcubacteria group bacterium Gr01-1014_56]